MSDAIDPDRISAMLQCDPSDPREKGKLRNSSPGAVILAQKNGWTLSIDSDSCGDGDFDQALKLLLSKLSDDPYVWDSLSETCKMDVFCGIFLDSANRGFAVSADACHLLSRRRLSIGFDIYAATPRL